MDTRRTRPPLRAPLRLLGAAAAVATLLAVILTGCGGGGDAPSSSPAAPAAGTGAASDEFGASGQDTEQMAGPAQDSAAGSGAAQDSGQKSGGTSSKAASPGSSGSAGLLADPSAITKRVRTADLIVRVKDLSAAAATLLRSAQPQPAWVDRWPPRTASPPPQESSLRMCWWCACQSPSWKTRSAP